MLRDTVNKSNGWKVLVGALVALILIDLTPLGGNTVVYVKMIECGLNVPLRSGTAVLGEVPYYTSTPLFGVLRGQPKYFCTAEQAELAGYSARSDKYEYPHLNETEMRNALYKSRGL